MRIGIDLDDTLTDIKDKLESAALKYANSLNKNVLDNEFDDDNKGNKYRWIEPTIEMIEDVKKGVSRKYFIEKYNSRAVWEKIRKQLKES